MFVNIRMENGQFVFSAVNPTSRAVAYADLCADPTRVDGAALTQRAHAADPGNFWTISDNYSVTPDKALIKALREAARTGKFKDPTALRRPPCAMSPRKSASTTCKVAAFNSPNPERWSSVGKKNRGALIREPLHRHCRAPVAQR